MSLPLIVGKELPRLAYAHGAGHDPELTGPQHFRPVVADFAWIKPNAGGLWTAPVTQEGADGSIMSSAWSDWCRSEQVDFGHLGYFQEIIPAPDARVLRIDGLADLRAILDTYSKHTSDVLLSLYPNGFPDWERMVGDGIDAVYLSDSGQWETRMPPHGEPSMYSWDASSVLWLRPNYTVAAS